MNGIPPIDIESSLTTFKSIRNPQKVISSEDNDYNKGYWDVIYALVLEGRLTDAWELISLHSEIIDIISNKEVINSSVAGLESDRRVLQSIYNILNTHPYIHLIALAGNINDDGQQSNIPPNIALEFKDWQDKVTYILQGLSPLFARISGLNTLLLTLLGDKDTIVKLVSYCTRI